MTAHPPFRKVLDGVATREQMFQLFSRHKDTPGIDPLSGTPYSGEWFQITASEYHFMLDLLEEHFYAAPTGETLSHFTIVYVPPDRTTRYRDSDRRWINECVAIGDCILMLFEANTDEVFVLSRARPSQPPRSRTIPAHGPFQSRVRALAAEGDRGSREGQGDYRRTPRPAG
ncbi:DUF1419 domain-containing protein [Mesorhizobium sp. M0859]|uniref:DUF1419 domain-containing protein n=1 Tax=Mesorhizobium sp. M0859 TaxID=2957014 RepID=UPI00333817A5